MSTDSTPLKPAKAGVFARRWLQAFGRPGSRARARRLGRLAVDALPDEWTALETGKPSPQDPQFAGLDPIAPVRVDRMLRDGDTVVVGAIVLTAHSTPVHAPGSTSWTWTSCAAPKACRRIAYADSSSTISSKRAWSLSQPLMTTNFGMP